MGKGLNMNYVNCALLVVVLVLVVVCFMKKKQENFKNPTLKYRGMCLSEGEECDAANGGVLKQIVVGGKPCNICNCGDRGEDDGGVCFYGNKCQWKTDCNEGRGAGKCHTIFKSNIGANLESKICGNNDKKRIYWVGKTPFKCDENGGCKKIIDIDTHTESTQQWLRGDWSHNGEVDAPPTMTTSSVVRPHHTTPTSSIPYPSWPNMTTP
jgi:hypothetical protein